MDKARDLIAEHLGVSRALIQDQVSFRELGADSLDLVSLTMAFEEAFDLSISDELAEACTTVGDAISLLEHHLGHSSQAALAPADALVDERLTD
jgi:acyl carrier protein